MAQTHSFLYKIESSVKIAEKKINVDGMAWNNCFLFYYVIGAVVYSKYHFLSSFLWSIVVPQGNKRDHLMVLELWRSLIQPTMRSFCFDGHMDKVRTPLEHPLKSSNHEFCTAAHETSILQSFLNLRVHNLVMLTLYFLREEDTEQNNLPNLV